MGAAADVWQGEAAEPTSGFEYSHAKRSRHDGKSRTRGNADAFAPTSRGSAACGCLICGNVLAFTPQGFLILDISDNGSI